MSEFIIYYRWEKNARNNVPSNQINKKFVLVEFDVNQTDFFFGNSPNEQSNQISSRLLPMGILSIGLILLIIYIFYWVHKSVCRSGLQGP